MEGFSWNANTKPGPCSTGGVDGTCGRVPTYITDTHTHGRLRDQPECQSNECGWFMAIRQGTGLYAKPLNNAGPCFGGMVYHNTETAKLGCHNLGELQRSGYQMVWKHIGVYSQAAVNKVVPVLNGTDRAVYKYKFLVGNGDGRTCLVMTMHQKAWPDHDI